MMSYLMIFMATGVSFLIYAVIEVASTPEQRVIAVAIFLAALAGFTLSLAISRDQIN
jgi:hypothetical protein